MSTETRKADRREKKWLWFLLAALAAYTIKNIFVGADVDESYGVTLGYRLVQGDRLLRDMWEPHQTSAIFTALFIRLTLLFTGGSLNYLTVLLRVEFFLVQGGITYFLYRTLKNCFPWLEREYLTLFTMIYYITTPKCIYVPEYSCLHLWFSTLLALFLLRYYSAASRDAGKTGYLAAAGCALACDVLAYPSMAVFFPLCVGYILLRPVRGRLRETAAFALPCAVGAAVFLGYVCSYMTPEEILSILPYVVGDGSHQMGVVEKIGIVATEWLELGLMTAGCGIVAAVAMLIWRRLRGNRETQERESFWIGWLFFWFLAQVVLQIYYWFTGDYNSGYPQIAYVAVPLFGAVCYVRSGKRQRSGIFLIALALVNYIALILFSNWGPLHLGVYLVMGLLGGFLCWRQYFQERMGSRGDLVLQVICLIFLVSNLFGRCAMMIGGENSNSFITEVRGYNREGVRAGILTAYMNAYRYNTNYEEFGEIVPEGSMVLYLGPSQFYYMMGDCRIASPTTISTPVFDESLEVYYELHPERVPDVVVVESTYGDVSYFAEDSYIMRWIEEKYQPSEMTDYPYVRVYRK